MFDSVKIFQELIDEIDISDNLKRNLIDIAKNRADHIRMMAEFPRKLFPILPVLTIVIFYEWAKWEWIRASDRIKQNR